MIQTTIPIDSVRSPRRNVQTGLLGTVVLAASALLLGGTAHADLGATHSSLVSEFASFNTPGVVDGRVEAIAVDGDTVFVGGTFTQVRDPLGGELVDQPYLFAYSKSSGDIIRDFDPVLNNKVYALETTGEGSGVFVGGVFSTLNGETNRRGLVKIDDAGDRIFGFSARPDSLVKALVRRGDTLYVGGNFARISQTPVENLAALDTATGAVSPNLNLDFDGTISTNFTTGVQGVDDIDITSDGRVMVVVGNFTSIDGASRPRLAVLEMDGQARVSSWNTDVFDVQCPASRFPQYIKGMDIAPDDAYFVTGSTGFRRPGLQACDSVARYDFGDLTDTDAQPTWINYTGGDSVYEVVATDHAVYAGGHFRWMNNENTSDGRSAGPGSVPRRGMAALDPLNGLTLLNWRADRNPRGVGTFALIAEDEGLYIGDDTDFLNGTEHPKLKFLPISGDTIARPDAPTLPTTLVSPRGDALDGSSFDGASFGAPMELDGAGWQNMRGAMFVGGQLFHADSNGRMWVSGFNGNTFEPREQVNLFGLHSGYWNLPQLGGMFFDHERGRVYYTIQGDPLLYWRAFTPASPYFGELQFVAEQQGGLAWGNVTGMDIVDGHLYLGATDGYLYRTDLDGVSVIAGTATAISGPNIDGRSWNNPALAFLAEGMLFKGPDDAEFEFQSSGTDTIRRFQTFEFPVVPGEPVVIRLSWANPNAKLNLFVRDANGDPVDSDTTANGSPKWLTLPAGPGGTYTAAVLIDAGTTGYTLQVNPVEEPPAPRADFEFVTSGSATDGSWQVFNFDVAAGELVEAQVIWDDPNADVSVFLRDATRSAVDRDTDGSGSPGTVSAIAETAGRWSIGVKINSGTVNYDVLVDTTTDFVAPVPLADFEFEANGSATDGSWQVFSFDVVAGQLVEAEVIWDDPGAQVRIFLRDETRTAVAKDTDGSGSPAMASAIASSSGRWSVAVKIDAGATRYDVLVDTSN